MNFINEFVSFPNISKTMKTKYHINNLLIQGFGFDKDIINIDFSNSTPYIITDILKFCTFDENKKIKNTSFFWDLTIGKRIECLLKIILLNNTHKKNIYVNCLNSKCNENIEFEFSLEKILTQYCLDDYSDQVEVKIKDNTIFMRKPTGLDQLELLKIKNLNETSIKRDFIKKLVFKQEILNNNVLSILYDNLDLIDDLLSEHDPLIDFNISLICPVCNHEK